LVENLPVVICIYSQTFIKRSPLGQILLIQVSS